jgi:hypothetical protein
MGNYFNQLSINEIHDQISKIISNMSEAEIQKLLDGMPEAGIQKLLKGLEKRRQSKPVDKRKYYRKDSSIYAICETDQCYFRDFIKNVSAEGLFLETETALSAGDEIFISFFHPDSKTSIKTTGKIVSVDPKGVGVKLHDIIPSI